MTSTSWRISVAASALLLLVSCERQERGGWIAPPTGDRPWAPGSVWRIESTSIVMEAFPVPGHRFNKHLILKRDGEAPVTIDAPEDETWDSLVLSEGDDKAYVLVMIGRAVPGRTNQVEFHVKELVELTLPSGNDSLREVRRRVLWEPDDRPFLSKRGVSIVGLDGLAGDGRGLLVRASGPDRPVRSEQGLAWESRVVRMYFDVETGEVRPLDGIE